MGQCQSGNDKIESKDAHDKTSNECEWHMRRAAVGRSATDAEGWCIQSVTFTFTVGSIGCFIYLFIFCKTKSMF